METTVKSLLLTYKLHIPSYIYISYYVYFTYIYSVSMRSINLYIVLLEYQDI